MKNILIFCGGRSAEHEISIISARNILKALDRDYYNPHVVGIGRDGSWRYLKSSISDDLISLDELSSHDSTCCLAFENQASYLKAPEQSIKIDIAFPILHGPYGEDGAIQGLLEFLRCPYVGSGVLASALGMEKDLFKKVLSFHNIPLVPSCTLTQESIIPFESVVSRFQTSDLFVKASSLGSSIGVYKVKNAKEFQAALELAFQYAPKVVVEKGIKGRELECSVLGTLNPQVSGVGEIVPNHEFYSYEAKYLDPQGAKLIMPAPLSQEVEKKIQELSLKVFQILGCTGMARVDFFLENDSDVYVNEINTIPGFTSISMYPKLWEMNGVPYRDLISFLIEDASKVFEIKEKGRLYRD